MVCALNDEHLLAFHFGGATDPERVEVESHLLACVPCLKRYFALKEDIDAGARAVERPSPEVRAAIFAKAWKLQRDAQSQLEGRPERPARGKRGPLVLAATAAAAAIVVVAASWEGGDPPPAEPRRGSEASMVRTLDGTIDKANDTPGHLGML